MNINDQIRDFVNNNNENQRNRELVKSILALAEAQRQSNLILEKELEDSRKETKRSVLFNIISSAIAAASLAVTILIAIFS